MQNVDIEFRNLQSHEHTKFSIGPGINFILADDNNVGKSAIFKVLSTLAKAPNNSVAKLDGLVRNGCTQASAVFNFDNERVIAWFTRMTGQATKLFFEHVTEAGTTRSVCCPSSLIKALGIVIGENGEIVNFNDADSVQLISKSSVEADAIITHVMLDARVEQIKSNILSLSKDIALDSRHVAGNIEASERILKEMVYLPEVDDFVENQSALQFMCKIADSAVSELLNWKDVPSDDEVAVLSRMIELHSSVGQLSFTGYSKLPFDISELQRLEHIKRLLELLNGVMGVNLRSLKVNPITEQQEYSLSRLQLLCKKQYVALTAVNALSSVTAQLKECARNKQEIIKDLKQLGAQQVDCPVKGRVLYTDEQCIPYSD